MQGWAYLSQKGPTISLHLPTFAIRLVCINMSPAIIIRACYHKSKLHFFHSPPLDDGQRQHYKGEQKRELYNQYKSDPTTSVTSINSEGASARSWYNAPHPKRQRNRAITPSMVAKRRSTRQTTKVPTPKSREDILQTTTLTLHMHEAPNFTAAPPLKMVIIFNRPHIISQEDLNDFTEIA